MIERFIDFLIRLAPRERVLLALLVVVILPAALVLGWLLPLSEARSSAQTALAEAQALDSWVMGRQAEKAALALPSDSGVVAPAIGASALEQSLISAQLRPSLSTLETRDGGEIALRFDAVNFVDLMRWMDAEDPAWGYQITALRIDRTDRSAVVEAGLTLQPLGQ
ncbi:type II secretion system protein GspM [Roseovarius sp. 2305UL8-3]|uniref:type II secretion system protein GspM n=1 Tax=Roseovarius conchicola TaxID=3121636 RepID=UPI003528BEF4